MLTVVIPSLLVFVSAVAAFLYFRPKAIVTSMLAGAVAAASTAGGVIAFQEMNRKSYPDLESATSDFDYWATEMMFADDNDSCRKALRQLGGIVKSYPQIIDEHSSLDIFLKKVANCRRDANSELALKWLVTERPGLLSEPLFLDAGSTKKVTLFERRDDDGEIGIGRLRSLIAELYPKAVTPKGNGNLLIRAAELYDLRLFSELLDSHPELAKQAASSGDRPLLHTIIQAFLARRGENSTPDRNPSGTSTISSSDADTLLYFIDLALSRNPGLISERDSQGRSPMQFIDSDATTKSLLSDTIPYGESSLYDLLKTRLQAGTQSKVGATLQSPSSPKTDISLQGDELSFDLLGNLRLPRHFHEPLSSCKASKDLS